MKRLYKPIFLTLLLLIFVFSCNKKTTDPTSDNSGGNTTSKFDPSEVEILIPVTYYLNSRVSGNLTSFKSVQSETGKTVYEIPITFNDERLLDEIDYIRVSYKGVNVRETALTEYRKEDLGDYLKTYLVSLTNESSGEVNELYLGLYTELQFSKYMVKRSAIDLFSIIYNDTLGYYTNDNENYLPPSLNKYEQYDKTQLKNDIITALNESVMRPNLVMPYYYPRYDYEFIGDFLVEDNVSKDEILEWMNPADYKRLTFKVKPRAFKGYRFTDKENLKEYSAIIYLDKNN